MNRFFLAFLRILSERSPFAQPNFMEAFRWLVLFPGSSCMVTAISWRLVGGCCDFLDSDVVNSKHPDACIMTKYGTHLSHLPSRRDTETAIRPHPFFLATRSPVSLKPSQIVKTFLDLGLTTTCAKTLSTNWFTVVCANIVTSKLPWGHATSRCGAGGGKLCSPCQ